MIHGASIDVLKLAAGNPRLEETIPRTAVCSVHRTKPILCRDPARKLTFWSIPPFRERLREARAPITVRQARFFITAVYANLYLHYGMWLPALLWQTWSRAAGTSPPAMDLAIAAIPYTFYAGIACALGGAVVGGGAAWYIVTLAIKSREPSRLRCFAIWGALGAGGPALLMVAALPAERHPALLTLQFLPLLFGAGIGAAVHWVVQRDRGKQATGHVEPVMIGTSVVTRPSP